jgi:hypothetical protein
LYYIRLSPRTLVVREMAESLFSHRHRFLQVRMDVHIVTDSDGGTVSDLRRPALYVYPLCTNCHGRSEGASMILKMADICSAVVT